MKKIALSLLFAAVCSGWLAGAAFAESKMSKDINELVGVRYKWAGTSTNGFDCSGFTQYLFNGFGIDLPHSSKGQAQLGEAVNKSDLRAGDLVFFNTDGKGISHVGVYVGGGYFVHSATNQGVVFTELDDAYYAKRYVTARRILSDEKYEELMTDVAE